MSAASTPPQRTTKIRHLPPEILEKILENLAVKSLVRFSSVSKSWNSMIFESRFVQEHKCRGRGKIVTMPSPFDELTAGASICRISHTSSAIEDSRGLIYPIEEITPHRRPHLLAFCDELWLVETYESLFLWNHSMRSSRDLRRRPRTNGFLYGLAYDSAADDYKVFKITRRCFSSRKTELYSLKSDSWEYIEPLFEDSTIEQIEQKKCEFVNGAFHWIVTSRSDKRTITLVALDLSTKTNREVALPPAIKDGGGGDTVEAAVLRGKLCVCVNYWDYIPRFFLWVMEEYGVEKSWTKKLEIKNPYGQHRTLRILRPLCLYDNGDILFNALSGIRIMTLILSNALGDKENIGLFMYKNEGARLEEIIDDRVEICGGFIYVESLVRLK